MIVTERLEMREEGLNLAVRRDAFGFEGWNGVGRAISEPSVAQWLTVGVLVGVIEGTV